MKKISRHLPDTMKVKSKTERADVVNMVKKYFGHIMSKAHEEAAWQLQEWLKLLIDEVDENSYIELIKEWNIDL